MSALLDSLRSDKWCQSEVILYVVHCADRSDKNTVEHNLKEVMFYVVYDGDKGDKKIWHQFVTTANCSVENRR